METVIKCFTVVTIILIFSLTLIAIFVPAIPTQSTNGEYTTYNNQRIWISPDGVHYWVHGTDYTPRYNHEGNLVIENWDIQ